MDRFINLNYHLTQKAALHGCSCKLPRRELSELLQKANLEEKMDERVLAGVGDDAGIVRISEDKAMVQHLDFFTPIIDDPYLQGQIAACNSASDVFAKGATDVVGVLVILGIPSDIPETVLTELIRGFQDLCSTIKAPIVGGHTILSPWPLMGGAITAITKMSNVIYNNTARPGDVLFLTKPLGTQPTMAILRVPPKEQEVVSKDIPKSTVSRAIDKAIEVMITPNKEAAEAMIEAEVSAATDITGFGILGQSIIMAKRSNVGIQLHMLPVIEGSIELSRTFGYGLEEGLSAETSGGLLISVPKEKAGMLTSCLKQREISAYEVGVVRKGEGHARLSRKLQIIEV